MRSPRALVLAATLLLALCGVRADGQGTSGQGSSTADLEAAVSRERELQGLKPVQPSAALRKAAQAQADDMVRAGYFALEAPPGSPTIESLVDKEGYRFTLVTEKLARVPLAQSLENLVAGWHAAPEASRSSLFRADVRDIGVGVAESGELRIVTIVLAAASGAETASPQEAALSALAREPAPAQKALSEAIAAQRRAWGLAPLRVDALLGEAAARHAEDLLAALIANRPAGEVVPLADLVAGQRARSGAPIQMSGEVNRQRRHGAQGSGVGESVRDVIVTDAASPQEALAAALRQSATALRDARYRVVGVALAVRPPAGATPAGHSVWVIALATH